MRGDWFAVVACVVVLCSCEERKECVVVETRPVTTSDPTPKLSATSDERFRNAKPCPVRGDAPDGWVVVPATEIRLLNYRFGEAGEVWVSISSGSVLDNINRWLHKQFGAPAIDQAAVESMRHVAMAGASGVWVEASGDYSPGMGSAAQSGYALAGVVAADHGRILTVKMVGPQAEVAAQKAKLETFVGTLKWVD